MPRARITESERARRRLLQQQKIAKARRVLGSGFAIGTAFAIFKWIREYQLEQRQHRQHKIALEWARQERMRTDAEFRLRATARQEQRAAEERKNPEQRLREQEEFMQRQEEFMQRQAEAAMQQLHYNQRARAASNVQVDARNAAEAKFVAEHQPRPIDPNTLPECYGPDPISQEDVDLKENPDAVAIIYERGAPSIRAHCYERQNFAYWWAPGNLGSSSLYAYDDPQNRSDYQIFRLPNDQTYVTENSTKVLLTDAATKIFQRVFYKDVHTHKGLIKLYVLVPVPVVGH